jgi:hypothetical protein
MSRSNAIAAVIAALALGAATAVPAQRDWSKVEIKSTRVADGYRAAESGRASSYQVPIGLRPRSR